MNTKLINNDLYGRITRTAILAFGLFIAFQAGHVQPAIIIANKQITMNADYATLSKVTQLQILESS